jgi:hypothetical protein
LDLEEGSRVSIGVAGRNLEERRGEVDEKGKGRKG